MNGFHRPRVLLRNFLPCRCERKDRILRQLSISRQIPLIEPATDPELLSATTL
jgi:hypothetical protein